MPTARTPGTTPDVGPLRRALDGLYDASAALAALAMVGLLLAIVASVAGREFGFNLTGIDGYAGYLLAATGFLSLAQTLKRGEHIRVTLVVHALPPRWRRGAELWALFASVLLAALFAWYSARLAWQSHEFHDVSTGGDATPLWIPQIAMAVGAAVLVVALLDELVLELRGLRRPAQAEESLRNE